MENNTFRNFTFLMHIITLQMIDIQLSHVFNIFEKKLILHNILIEN